MYQRLLVHQHDGLQQQLDRFLVEPLLHQNLFWRQVVVVQYFEHLRRIEHRAQIHHRVINQPYIFKGCDVDGRRRIQVELSLNVLDNMRKRNWRLDEILVLVFEHVFYEFLAVINKSVDGSLVNLGDGFALSLHSRNCGSGINAEEFLVRLGVIDSNQVEMHVDVLDRHVYQGNVLVLNAGGVDAIFAVGELDDFSHIVADGAIIFYLQVFQTLDQTTLDISSLRRLDGSVDETHTTTHRVEEELGRSQAGNVRVFDKSTRAWRIVIFAEMRQCTVIESIGHTLAVDTLLSDARNHLGNVQHRTLGARLDNHDKSIVGTQVFNRNFAGLASCVIQHIADLGLKLDDVGATRVVLHDSEMNLVRDILDLLHLGANHSRDLVGGVLV